jgi:hypothetical protein
MCRLAGQTGNASQHNNVTMLSHQHHHQVGGNRDVPIDVLLGETLCAEVDCVERAGISHV